MQKPIADRLSKLSDEGAEADSARTMDLWANKVAAFLGTASGAAEAASFSRLSASGPWETHALRMGHVLGLIAKAERPEDPTLAKGTDAVAPSTAGQGAMFAPDSNKVFVVHGHDNEAKEGAARFLQRLGLQPIVLHEQPNSGRTIIEKFETYSGDIAFAVILLTPDDFGGVATTPDVRKPRARQNVVMELGYFMGKLGRARVCALHRGDVELPSDYQGVLFIELDTAGAWKTKLAQEFVQAKLPIELSGLLGG